MEYIEVWFTSIVYHRTLTIYWNSRHRISIKKAVKEKKKVWNFFSHSDPVTGFGKWVRSECWNSLLFLHLLRWLPKCISICSEFQWYKVYVKLCLKFQYTKTTTLRAAAMLTNLLSFCTILSGGVSLVDHLKYETNSDDSRWLKC